jgi:hypothetical protein
MHQVMALRPVFCAGADPGAVRLRVVLGEVS